MFRSSSAVKSSVDISHNLRATQIRHTSDVSAVFVSLFSVPPIAHTCIDDITSSNDEKRLTGIWVKRCHTTKCRQFGWTSRRSIALRRTQFSIWMVVQFNSISIIRCMPVPYVEPHELRWRFFFFVFIVGATRLRAIAAASSVTETFQLTRAWLK